MTTFVPNKRNLREALLFCFHLKKTTAASRLLLEQAYGDSAPSISTCEHWFRRFKSGDFDTDDKERPGQPKSSTVDLPTGGKRPKALEKEEKQEAARNAPKRKKKLL